MNAKCTTLLLILLSLVFSNTLFAQEETTEPQEQKRDVIVLPLAANGVPESVTASLTDLLASELERTYLYEVMAQNELQALLGQVEFKQLMGVDSDEDLARASQKLDSDFLIRGSVGKVGATYLLALTLIDVKNASVVRRVNQTLTGDQEGLIGSLHAAVVALALEEKGIAPDITAGLIESLNISRKKKNFFLTFRTGYEMPVGPTNDDSSFAYLLPGLLTLNVSGGIQVKPWMQVVIETGFATSIAERYSAQNRRVSFEQAQGSMDFDAITDVSVTELDYQTMRIPLNLMVRFQPSEGRLLPYFQAGLGFSWQQYSLDDEKMQLVHVEEHYQHPDYAKPGYQPVVNTQCNVPYAFNKADGQCQYSPALQAQNDTISYFNLQMPLALGIEYLVTHHFGIGVEVRYLLTYALNKNDDDLNTNFWLNGEDLPLNADKTAVELVEFVDDNGKTHSSGYSIGDNVPIRRLHHGINAMIGLFYYF